MQPFEAWLTLTHVNQLGPVAMQKLFSRFETPEHILQASYSELQSTGINKSVIDGIQKPKQEAINRDLLWLKNENHHLITLQDNLYPELLKQIPDPPYVLYVLGKPELVANLLNDPQLGIVGSRNASAYGKEIATSFAEKLANSGLVITSCLLYTSPSPRDATLSRMPSSA